MKSLFKDKVTLLIPIEYNGRDEVVSFKQVTVKNVYYEDTKAKTLNEMGITSTHGITLFINLHYANVFDVDSNVLLYKEYKEFIREETKDIYWSMDTLHTLMITENVTEKLQDKSIGDIELNYETYVIRNLLAFRKDNNYYLLEVTAV